MRREQLVRHVRDRYAADGKSIDHWTDQDCVNQAVWHWGMRYDPYPPAYGPPWNLRVGGWQMGQDDLKAWLGLPKKLHPTEAGPVMWVGNVRVGVDGKVPGSKGRPHRVWAECPNCGKRIPAGRLHQHMGRAAIGGGRKVRPCTER